MRNRTRILLTITVLTVLTAALSNGEPDKKLDLKGLEGNWEGTGEFLVPATSMRMLTMLC